MVRGVTIGLGLALSGGAGCVDGVSKSGSGTTGSTGTAASTGAMDGSATDASSTSTGGPGPSAARLYAIARCAAAARCACDVEAFETLTQCEISLEDRFVAWQARFEIGAFDVGCFEQIVSFYEMSGCETRQEIGIGQLAPACVLYTGDQQRLEVCSRGGGTATRGDECAEGLRCFPTLEGFRCHPPEDLEALTPALDETCIGEDEHRAGCEAGTFCDAVGSRRCELQSALGEACIDPAGCESGNWCDETSVEAPVCAAQLAPGSTCGSTASCAPGDCVQGVCAAAVCHRGRCDVAIPQVCLLSDL